jgi:hypothetical protein
MMRSSDPLDPRAVLGAVKARPGSGRARREVSATAGLDGPLRATRRRLAGRDEGTAPARTKELREMRSAQ